MTAQRRTARMAPGRRVEKAQRFDQWDLGAEALARALLGQVLVRIDRGVRLSGTIIETEAYLGGEDLGSHSAGGRRTQRNESMFLPGGHLYVYLVYGMHHCLNVVAAPVDTGCAVLIRAVDPIDGIARMKQRRGTAAAQRKVQHLCAGPGRLCAALGITRDLDRESLIASKEIFIERAGAISTGNLAHGPRIGIAYAGAWAKAPLRFGIADHPALSRSFR